MDSAEEGVAIRAAPFALGINVLQQSVVEHFAVSAARN
jgi:hypothetical protein